MANYSPIRLWARMILAEAARLRLKVSPPTSYATVRPDPVGVLHLPGRFATVAVRHYDSRRAALRMAVAMAAERMGGAS